MKEYTPYQYMLIDIANQYGLDKKTFEERIEWTRSNIDTLEIYALEADKPILFAKAVHHLRKIQRGEPTGYMVSADSTASGIQLLACLTGCKKTAMLTNLIDPDDRKDAYTECMKLMNDRLPEDMQIREGGLIDRKGLKESVMVYFYGGEAKVKEIFHEGSKPYYTFFETMREELPGAYDARNVLIDIWDPKALSNTWILPDGHTAHIPVTDKKDFKIEVQELDGATMTHRTTVNTSLDRSVSLSANSVHSVDSYVVREMHRRCNHNKEALQEALRALRTMIDANPNSVRLAQDLPKPLVSLGLINLDPVRVTDTKDSVYRLTVSQALALVPIVEEVLARPSFEIATIHDDFWCSPLYMNHLRYWYKEILAEIAESDLLETILNQITNDPDGKYEKLSYDLAPLIRQSNYALS